VKDKTVWQAAFGLILVVVLLAATGNLSLAGTAKESTISTSDNAVGVVVSCFKEEDGVKYGLQPAEITILDTDGVAVYPTTYQGTGQVSLDKDQGFRKGGQYVVVCENNTDDGSYRSEKSETFDKDINAVEVPMKMVGDAALTWSATSLTMTTDNLKSIELDIATDTAEEWLYRPIIAVKDLNASDQVIATGEIVKVYPEKSTKVNCDLDAMVGYNFCYQLDQEWISVSDSVDDLKIWFDSDSVEPSGYVTVTIFDGVPGEDAGTASINDADAYDDDSTGQVITIV